MKLTFFSGLILMVGMLMVIFWRDRHGRDDFAKVSHAESEPKNRSNVLLNESLPDDHAPEGKPKSGVTVSTRPDLKEFLLRRTNKNWVEAARAMNTFLNEWRPVGHSLDELIKNVGEPSEIRRDIASYQFDGGFNGAVFEFTIKDGKIVSVKCVEY